jgi:hypothetical protein
VTSEKKANMPLRPANTSQYHTDMEDRKRSDLVDGDNGLAVLHSGQMLDSATDANGNVEFRRNDLAGLADLQAVVCIATVDSGTGCTDGSAKGVSEREDD